MRIVDWRELTPDQVAPLYEEHTRRWVETLGWDLTQSWAMVEGARAAGVLPGLVCRRADGTIAAWTFFLRHGDVLQIGALAGHGASPVRAVLEAILDSPEAAATRELTCLLYPAPPHAIGALTRRRFAIQSHQYRARAIGGDEAAPTIAWSDDLVVRRWRDEDAMACVRLLARAYAREPTGRALAPRGTLAEWAHYLGQLVRTPACGALSMRASFVVEARADGAPVAFVLTTTLGPGTAHIAQVAVDPQWGRRGIGRSLVRLAASAAAADGMRRLTLLVSAENTPASCLYQAEGFDEIGRFVFASRFTPVRRQMTRRRAA